MSESGESRRDCKHHTNECSKGFTAQDEAANTKESNCQESNEEIGRIGKPNNSHCQVSKQGQTASKRLFGLFSIECDVKVHNCKNAENNAVENGAKDLKT